MFPPSRKVKHVSKTERNNSIPFNFNVGPYLSLTFRQPKLWAVSLGFQSGPTQALPEYRLTFIELALMCTLRRQDQWFQNCNSWLPGSPWKLARGAVNRGEPSRQKEQPVEKFRNHYPRPFPSHWFPYMPPTRLPLRTVGLGLGSALSPLGHMPKEGLILRYQSCQIHILFVHRVIGMQFYIKMYLYLFGPLTQMHFLITHLDCFSFYHRDLNYLY